MAADAVAAINFVELQILDYKQTYGILKFADFESIKTYTFLKKSYTI